MTTPDPLASGGPDPLASLLSGAVDDVEPLERLIEIRLAAAAGRARRTRTRWTSLVAVGGVAASVATVVTLAVVTSGGDGAPPVAATGSTAGSTAGSTEAPSGSSASGDTSEVTPTACCTDTPTPTAPTAPTAPTGSAAPGTEVTAFHVGDTYAGPRLFGTTLTLPAGDTDPMLALLDDLTVGGDGDGGAGAGALRDLWPEGSFASGGFDGIGAAGTFSVVLSDPSLEDLPAGMSPEEARLAVQAVVFSLERSFGRARAVDFYVGHGVVDRVLGVDVSGGATPDAVLDTQSHVWFAAPQPEGSYAGTLDFSGFANSFEATVVVRLQRHEGTEIVWQEPVTATGWQGDRLYPFHGSVDLAGLEPGTYDLIAMTDDPSGQGHVFSDVRTVQVLPGD